MSVSRLPYQLLLGLIGLFGTWQAIAVSAAYAGVSFAVVDWLLPLCVLGGVGLAWLGDPPERSTPPPSVGDATHPLAPLTLLAAAAGWVAFAWYGAPMYVGAALTLLHIGIAWWDRKDVAEGHGDPFASPLDLGALALSGLAAAAITSVLCRWDDDDGFYMNTVITHLQHPDLPVMGFDGIHGDWTAPLQDPLFRPATYDVFAASICSWTGAHPHDIHWLILPALLAAAGMLTHWAMLKLMVPRLAWVAVLLTPFVLLAWGDGYYTPGRFAWVRFFVGKSIFVTVFVPTVVWSGWRFLERPDWRRWLVFAAAQLACVCFTSTAIVLVPIGAALTLLTGLTGPKALPKLAIGGLASVPVFALVFLAWLDSQGTTPNHSYMIVLEKVYGPERTPLVLTAVAALPLLLSWWRPAHSGWVTRYLVAIFLFLVNGVTTPILADLAGAKLLAWRTFWVFPITPFFTAAIAVAGAILVSRGRPIVNRAVAGALLLLLPAFFAHGMWTGDRGAFRVEWRPLDYKVDTYQWAAARHVVAVTDPDDLVLAPTDLGIAIGQQISRPRLVGTWKRYIRALTRHWGKRDARWRLRLMDAVNKRQPIPGDALDGLCVDVVVVNRIASELPELGYASSSSFGRYTVWERTTDCPNPDTVKPVREKRKKPKRRRKRKPE